MISQPATQPENAAVPGSDRSSTPVITPKPTPAAKIAVMAAAFATRSALSIVKKYGDAQKAKTSDQQAPEEEDAAVSEEDQDRDGAGHVVPGRHRRPAAGAGPPRPAVTSDSQVSGHTVIRPP